MQPGQRTTCLLLNEAREELGEFKSPKWRKTITGDGDGKYRHLNSFPLQAECELRTLEGKEDWTLKRKKRPLECYLEEQRRQFKTSIYELGAVDEKVALRAKVTRPKVPNICVPLKE